MQRAQSQILSQRIEGVNITFILHSIIFALVCHALFFSSLLFPISSPPHLPWLKVYHALLIYIGFLFLIKLFGITKLLACMHMCLPLVLVASCCPNLLTSTYIGQRLTLQIIIDDLFLEISIFLSPCGNLFPKHFIGLSSSYLTITYTFRKTCKFYLCPRVRLGDHTISIVVVWHVL